MASEITEMTRIEELEKELSSVREEYVRLQDHLADTELKYQSALANEKEDGGESQFTTELQTMVANLFNCERYSDVQVLLEHGRLFFGHKLVLAARSIYWGVADLSLAPTIDFKNINYDVAMAMLKWVYTDEISLEEASNDFLIELLRATTKFHLESLFGRCQKMLISKINEENCQYFYRVGNELSSTTLRNHCLEFMTRGTDGVVIVTDDPTSNSPIKTSTSTQLDCDVCHKRFTCNAKLKRHLLTHTGEKPFKCDLCDKSLSDKVCLKKHMLTQHTESMPKVEYSCSICCRSLANEVDLQAHEKLHLLDPVDLVCKFCFVKFPSNSQLKRHMLSHTKQKPFTCSECSKGFSSKYSLQEHFRRIHKDSAETVPFRAKNTKIFEVYVCDICGAKFKYQIQMKDHRLQHTGEKPHKCNVCQKTFRSKNSLKVHSKIHEGKNAKCDVCDKRFSLNYQLLMHKRVHTGVKPFTCDLCDRTFRYRESKVVHMRIHRNERPFVCDVCGHAFRTQWQIKRHKRTHTGEKPYVCKVCQKRFASPSVLQRHRQNVHKGSDLPQNLNDRIEDVSHSSSVKMVEIYDVHNPQLSANSSNQETLHLSQNTGSNSIYPKTPLKMAKDVAETTGVPMEVNLVEECGEVVIQIPTTETNQYQMSYPTMPFKMDEIGIEEQVESVEGNQSVINYDDQSNNLEEVEEICDIVVPVVSEENQIDAVVKSVAENNRINALVRANQIVSDEPQTIIVIQTYADVQEG